jgi:hypothetical protein
VADPYHRLKLQFFPESASLGSVCDTEVASVYENFGRQRSFHCAARDDVLRRLQVRRIEHDPIKAHDPGAGMGAKGGDDALGFRDRPNASARLSYRCQSRISAVIAS